jgi:hypothetical protein
MARLALLSAPLCALLLALAATPAAARPSLVVPIDHATRLTLSRPAGSVVVGNPAVADVTVVDAHTVFVTGKGYGVSEIVVVDPLGRTVWQGEVVVTAPQSGQVSVFRGSEMTDMACADICAPSVRNPKTSGSGQGGQGAAPGMPSTTISAPQASPTVP